MSLEVIEGGLVGTFGYDSGHTESHEQEGQPEFCEACDQRQLKQSAMRFLSNRLQEADDGVTGEGARGLSYIIDLILKG